MAEDAQRAAWRAAALAYVCEDLAYVRECLTSGEAVDLLLDAVREQRPVGDVDTALDALHHQLRLSGDALGVYGVVRGGWAGSGGSAVTPVGFSTSSAGPPPGDDTEKAYLCPHGHCDRFVWPEAAAAGDPPPCALVGRPMTLKHL